MPGARQHYLPRFLQRGFCSDSEGKRTWLYRKGADAKEVGIRDVGVADNFYRRGNDVSVDQAITLFESENVANLVRTLRSGQPGHVANDILPALIAHLEIRSNHLRATFTETAQKLYAKLLERLKQSGLLRTIVINRLRRDPTILVEAARGQLQSRGLPIDGAQQFAQLAERNIDTLDDAAIAPFWAALEPLFRQLLFPAVLQGVRTGQLNAMSQSVAPNVRASEYSRFDFETLDVDSELILGDSAVVFKTEGNRPFKPFVDKGDVVLAVLLPLSAHRLLLGKKSTTEVPIDPLREHLAACAHQFFIANVRSDANVSLIDQIGDAALPITDSGLDEIIEQILAERLS